MTRHEAEVVIAAPAERVWQVLADFGNVQCYNPVVRESRLTSDHAGGVGTSRHCELTLAGATVEERIVEWDEGRGYRLETTGGTRMPPFRHAHMTFRIAPVDDTTTRVTGVLDYQLRFGPIGVVMDRWMVGPRFGGAFRRALAGLKHHIETGEEIDGSTRL